MDLKEVQHELSWRLLTQVPFNEVQHDELRIIALRCREQDLQYPPCLRCERTVDLAGARQCNGCWEIETRLPEYLKHPAGRKYVEELLK